MALGQIGATIGVGALLQQYVSRKSLDSRNEKEIVGGQIRVSIALLDSLHTEFCAIGTQVDVSAGLRLISGCKILGMRLMALKELAAHCELPSSADHTEALLATFVRYRHALTEHPGLPSEDDRIEAKAGYQKLTTQALLMMIDVNRL